MKHKRGRHTTDGFKIDGTPMLNPDAGVEISGKTMEAIAERDESGRMHRVIKRGNLRTWKFKYSFLTEEEYAYITEQLQGKAEFSFTFYNEKSEEETIAAYCEGMSAAWWSARRGLYRDLQFTIVEC